MVRSAYMIALEEDQEEMQQARAQDQMVVDPYVRKFGLQMPAPLKYGFLRGD
jgi:hypothetical protein